MTGRAGPATEPWTGLRPDQGAWGPRHAPPRLLGACLGHHGQVDRKKGVGGAAVLRRRERKALPRVVLGNISRRQGRRARAASTVAHRLKLLRQAGQAAGARITERRGRRRSRRTPRRTATAAQPSARDSSSPPGEQRCTFFRENIHSEFRAFSWTPLARGRTPRQKILNQIPIVVQE